MNDLFGETGGQITRGAVSRANTVVEHWLEMASNGVRREKGVFFGDILNPLANRVHDSLWEMGDGNVVLHLVQNKLIEEPALAKVAFHNDVKRYVPSKLLAMANVILMADQSDYIGANKALKFIEKADDLHALISKHKTWDQSLERTYIEGSSYYGTIIDVSKHFALQHLGKSVLVAHDLSNLDLNLTAGKKADIKYEQSRGYVQGVIEAQKLQAIAR